MVVVPAVRADTKPVEFPIVATGGLKLVHVPPVTELLKVVVKPEHKVVVPDIAAGD